MFSLTIQKHSETFVFTPAFSRSVLMCVSFGSPNDRLNVSWGIKESHASDPGGEVGLEHQCG